MWSRKSRRKQRAALRKPVRCVHGAGRAPRGRAGVALGQPQSGSLIGCVAERAVHWDARSASFALHVGNLCMHFCHRSLGCPCAHAEIRTHACSVPRFAVVTRSESVASKRAIPLRVLTTAARMFRGGRVQNWGPLSFSSHVMFLGVLSMPRLIELEIDL